MFNIIRDILEFASLGGIVVMISLVSLAKMALGAVLTLAGAFFPSKQEDKSAGQANIKFAKVTAAFKGSLRYGVIVGGVLLIIGAIIDGAHDVKNGIVKGPIVTDDYMTSEDKQRLLHTEFFKFLKHEHHCNEQPSSEECLTGLVSDPPEEDHPHLPLKGGW